MKEDEEYLDIILRLIALIETFKPFKDNMNKVMVGHLWHVRDFIRRGLHHIVDQKISAVDTYWSELYTALRSTTFTREEIIGLDLLEEFIWNLKNEEIAESTQYVFRY